MEAPLEKIDKKFINGEIRQVIAVYLAMLLVLTVVFSVGFLFIKGLIKAEEYHSISLVIYSGVVYGVYFFFLIKHLKAPFYDLRPKTKNVLNGVVQEKSDNTNYGWTGNVGADLSSQPKLVEYFLKIDNVRYFVSEDDFKKVEEGDNTDIHLTSHTGKLIRIEKSENQPNSH